MTLKMLQCWLEKVKNGGSGVWGQTPMAAHPQLSEMEITEMVKYIMSLKENKKTIAS